MLRLLLLTFFLLALPVSGRAQEQADEPPRMFGIVEAYYRPVEAAQLGVSWERIIFHWYDFQPLGPRFFNTTAVSEAQLEAAASANREVVGLIKGTPAWASDSGSKGAVPFGLALPYDDPRNYFGAFVRQLVAYYSPRGIHRWIILNEPDIRPGEGIIEFEGEVGDYFLMLKTAYLAATSIDPQAQIYVAATTWWFDRQYNRRPYLERLLERIEQDADADANGWYFDGISLHIYFTTSSVWDIITANREILRAHGLGDKAIWLNEFNASPRRDPQAAIDALFDVSLEQQADFIVQAAATALAAGVERMAVYRLYDNGFTAGVTEPWGLVRADGSLRPAYDAYRQVIARFSGAQRVTRFHAPEATLITMTFPDFTLYVMWSDTFEGGEFLLHGGGLDENAEVEVADATGATWTIPLTLESGVPMAVVDAPPAEQIDFPWVVVAGPVRLAALDGAPRTAWFRTADGRVAQLR